MILCWRYFGAKNILFVNLLTAVFGSTCQPPNIPVRGSYIPIQDSYEPGNEVNYSCSAGYERMGGEQTRSCTAKGTWTGEMPFCDLPEKLHNARVTSEKDTSFDSVTPIDGNITSCLNTKNRVKPYVVITLGKTAIIKKVKLYLHKGYVNLELSIMQDRSSLNADRKKCSSINNYLESDQWVELNCTGNGISDSIVIQEMLETALEICEVEVYAEHDELCNRPPKMHVSNGHFQVSREKAILQCARGYKPRKSDHLICNSSKHQWTEIFLYCDEILCDRIQSNSNGHWLLMGNANKMAVGAVKHLKCKRDFTLEGSPDNVTCQLNGTWTSSTANCVESNVASSNTGFRGIILVISIVVCAVVIASLVLGLFLIIRKKFKTMTAIPDTTALSMQSITTELVCNEEDYSCISYDELSSSSNLTTFSQPQETETPVVIMENYSSLADNCSPNYSVNHIYTEPIFDNFRNTTKNGAYFSGIIKQCPLYNESST